MFLVQKNKIYSLGICLLVVDKKHLGNETREARASLYCFSAHSPHVPQHRHCYKNPSAIKANHVKPNLEHRTKPKHWCPLFPFPLENLANRDQKQMWVCFEESKPRQKGFSKFNSSFLSLSFLWKNKVENLSWLTRALVWWRNHQRQSSPRTAPITLPCYHNLYRCVRGTFAPPASAI